MGPLFSVAFTRDPRSWTEVFLPPEAEVGADAPPSLSFPPRHGEHDEMIYGEVLGMDGKRIEELRERGII